GVDRMEPGGRPARPRLLARRRDDGHRQRSGRRQAVAVAAIAGGQPVSRFERLLLDPDHATLLDGLATAAAQAELPENPQPEGPGLRGGVDRLPEGRKHLQLPSRRRVDPRYLSVAWWTDHLGHKHVRVAGGNPNTLGLGLYDACRQGDLRPPVWHV